MSSSNWTLDNASYSMISTWLTCRQKMAYKYRDRIQEPQGIYFPQGNTIHKALYDFHQTPEIDPTLLVDMANAYFDEEIEGKEFYDFKGRRLTEDEVINARIDTIRWIAGYVDAVNEGTFPFMEFATPPEADVERLCEGTGFTLRGYIDFFPGAVKVLPTGEVLMDCKDGSVHIGDFKTASKKFKPWNQAKADIDLQPTIYGYIMGKKPITFHYIVIEKTASHEKPSLKHIVTHRGPKDYAMVETMLADFERSADRLNQYKNGHFYPEPEMGFGKFCSKLCSYKDKCWEDNFADKATPIEEDGVEA